MSPGLVTFSMTTCVARSTMLTSDSSCHASPSSMLLPRTRALRGGRGARDRRRDLRGGKAAKQRGAQKRWARQGGGEEASALRIETGKGKKAHTSSGRA